MCSFSITHSGGVILQALMHPHSIDINVIPIRCKLIGNDLAILPNVVPISILVQNPTGGGLRSIFLQIVPVTVVLDPGVSQHFSVGAGVVILIAPPDTLVGGHREVIVPEEVPAALGFNPAVPENLTVGTIAVPGAGKLLPAVFLRLRIARNPTGFLLFRRFTKIID